MTIVQRSYYRTSNLYADVKEITYFLGGVTEPVAVNQGANLSICISSDINAFPEFQLDPFLFPEPGLK